MVPRLEHVSVMDESNAEMPSSSRIAASLGIGPTGALAGRAAAALIREEVAHALSSPTSFFGMLVRELEAGRAISAENVQIAGDEIARLQRFVSSLRAVPSIAVAPEAVRVASVLRAAKRDLALSSSPVELVFAVPQDLVVSADATALGFIVFTVASALFVKNTGQVRVATERRMDAKPARATLLFSPEGSEALDDRVFAPRAWAAGDGEALALAIARRVARASGMRLRPPAPGESRAIRLEVPLA